MKKSSRDGPNNGVIWKNTTEKKSSIEIINRKETKSIVSNIMASIDFLDPLWPFWGAEIKKRQTGFDSTPHHSTPYRATPLLTSPSDNDEIKSNYRIHISFAKKPISAKKKSHRSKNISQNADGVDTILTIYFFFRFTFSSVPA